MTTLADVTRKFMALQDKVAAHDRQRAQRAQRAQPILDQLQLEQDVQDLTWDVAHVVVGAEKYSDRQQATATALAGIREVRNGDGTPIPNGEPAPYVPTQAEIVQRRADQARYRAKQEALQLSEAQLLQREWETHRDEVNEARRIFRRDMILEGVEPSKLPADLPKSRPREWGLQDGKITTIPYVAPSDNVTRVTDLGAGSRRVERTVELGGTDPLGRPYQTANPLISPEAAFAAAAKETP